MRVGGEWAVVTGGCGGIGTAITQALLSVGKKVLLVDRDTSGGKNLDNENVRCLEVDLGVPDEIEHTLRPAIDELSPDILVNGVGISPKKDRSGNAYRSWEMPLEEWRRVMDVNLSAYFYCSRLVVPPMIAKGTGRIINIASLATRTGGYVAPVHYVASKAGVLGLTKVMAKELGTHGITVNAVNPGRIDTPMIHDVPDEVNQAYVKRIPAGRLGVPDDVAKVVLFLASDLADYITGTTIEVNGGLYMGP